MYNTCMSEEEMSNLKPGDLVVVRSLEDLRHDYGEEIYGIPNGWGDLMNEFCGKTLIVESVDCGWNCIKAEGNRWKWSRQMLEPYLPCTPISQEEISLAWEEMIFGRKNEEQQILG